MKKFFLVVLTLVGFASLSAQGMYDLFGYGSNATGGGNATPILVDTEQELIDALSGSKSNRVVIITDNITVSTQFTSKGSNITLLALPGKCLISNGQSSSASGILNMRGNNIIIRNVTFIGPGAYDCDGKDLLQFEDATNAWVDHCDFQDGCDGNFDIKSNGDNITITWCRFRYLKPAKSGGSGGAADHRFTNLLGQSSSAKPADGTYNVTYAHNWWDNGCKERMVRCRNCEIHFFNCYWNSDVANYYVGPENAKCYFEGCTFAGKANSKDKIFKSYGGTNACKFVNSVGNLPSNQGTVNNPSYRYFIESASDAVANITDPNCGAGATLVVETDGTIQTCGATLNKFVVTFNLNGKGTNFTQEVYENRTITTPANPTTTGFVFDGWYTNQACTSAFNFSTPITANTTLYAKWVQALTVTFNLNGHGDSFTQEVVSGAKVSAPSTPVSAGYVFVGWYSDQACTNEYDFNTPVTSAKTIYAKWEESNNCYEFILATTGTAPSVGDVILGTGVGGTMTMIGGVIEYSSNGLAFKSSGSSKVSVTLLTEMQVGTVITLNMYNGTTTERGLKLADGTGDVVGTYTQDGVGDFSASYIVTENDGLAGTSTFQLHRSNNSFLKSITVSNCGGSSCSNPELAYAATSIAKTDQDASFTNTLTNPHGLAVTYSSSNTNVATIASNGEVTIKGPGSTIITASAGAQGEYCAATVTYTLTVSATGGAAYPIDETDFPNPERGFYEHAEWSHASTGNYNDNLWDSYFTNAAAANRSLLLRIYYLDTDELRQDKQLPNGFITMFNNDMQKIRSNGMKCILRFAYDKKSDDGFQDASPATWETHLAQLKPHLQANADVIYVVQAGFLGVWGEWYYSSLGTGDEVEWSVRQNLIDQLLDAVPANRYVQLRTPLFKKKYLGNNNALTSAAAYHGSDQARLGHHNDAFLNGEENQGTYENRTADMAYIAQECLYVPIGGETNLDDGESSTYNTWCKGSIAEAEMAQLHYSYLNHSYSQYVTDQWKAEGAYARISRNMGYRFQLLSASFDAQVVAGTSMNVQLNIKNVGYAPLYNERYAYIVLKNNTNTYSIPLSSDPRTWAPNDATTAINEYITLPATMAPGTYDLYLYLPDASASIANNPKYAVRFANQGIWQASTGYNILNKQVVVTVAACSGANGTGSTFTAPGNTYMQNASAASMSITGVTASNGGALTYQWYKTTSDIAHGEVIDGATESTYTPSTAEAHDTWYYYCVVTETGCPVVYTTALSGAIVVNAATYTVTYNTNGADSATPTQEAVTEGTTIVLAAPASKANSIFVGWLCDVDANVYKAGDAYTVTAANTTFTAQWQELGEGCFVVNNTTLGSSTTLADGTQVVLDNCNADANGLSIGGNMLFTAPAGQYFESFTFTATCGSDGKNNYYKINGGSQQTLASSSKAEQTYTIAIPAGTNASTIQIIKNGTTPKVSQICYTLAEEPVPTCTDPIISTQPESKSILTGETALLSCAADKGVYQWYNATDNTAAGTGAAGTQVTTGFGYNAGGWTTPTFSTAGTYSYYCVITDGECSVQTNTVTISVTTAGGGGGDSYEYFVSEDDAAANSVTNSTIFNAPTDGGNAEGDITFNGKNYTITRRTSNAKHTITFDMPASWTNATLVLVHNQSGRNFTLKHPDATTVTGTNEENGDFRQNVFTITQSGTYTISNTENIGLIFIGLYPNSTAPTYEVTYDLADGTGTLPTQAATPEGGTFALASAEGLSKAGYSFAGWNDGTNTSSAGDTYTMPAIAVTLIAQWTCATPMFSAQPGSATYTVGAAAAALAVTADAKGGTLTYQWQSSTDNATFGNISGATTSTYTPATDAEGTIYYRCVVTNTTSGCSASQTSDVATITTTAAPVSYTVTFDANGHGTAPAAQSVESGSTATEPTDPTETGFVFGGWYTELACINAFDFSTAITTNITLYAKWTEVSSGGEVYYFIPYSANVSDGALVSGADGTKGIYKYDGSIMAANTEISATNTTSSAGFYYNSTSLEYSEFTKLSNYGTGSTSSKTMRGIKLASGKTIEINLNSKLFSQIDVIYSCASTDEKSIIIAGETCTTTDKDVHLKTITGNFSGTIKIENSSGKEYYLFIVLKEATCTDPALAYTTTTVDKSITDGKFTNPLTNSNSVTVTYSSDNTAVATVNETTGEVTIVGGGTATITASSAIQTISSVEYCADEASYTLTVDDSGLLTPTFVWTYHSEMATGGAYPISVSSDGGDVTLSITTTVAGVDLTSTSGNPATGTIAVSTCPSVLTIIVQATSPSTATHRAHTEQKTINITLCQKVYNIPMSSTVYKDNGSSVNPRYVCEVDGVGMLLKKLGTSTYSFSSGTNNDVFTECVTEKPFLVGTYLDNIFKIELYVNCGTKEKGVTVARRDSYSSSEGDYESITPTITYYTGGTVSEYMPNGAMGKVEILFDTPLNAGECVYIVCGASTKVYGAKLYRAEGDIETSVAFAGVGTINKFAGDEPFIQTATQTTEGIQSSGLITYSSSDKTVAIVDKNTGEVTPLSEGRTRIIATLTASGCYKSSSAEYTLIVKPCTDPECTIAVTEGAAKKCEGQTVTLTATAAEGATFQWYKDSALIAGETNASIVINDPGYYYVEARKVCMQSSNTIRVINLSDPTVTALYDYYYIKQGRETPDLPLFKLENTSTYTVSYTPAGCSYELRDDDILYLIGTPGAIGDGTQTLTVTAENTCGGADASASMTLYTLAATTKPSIAWIGCGDKGQTLPGSIEASQSTEQALYEYLETYFTLTPVNAYCTIDKKELRQYYSQFDLILLTDYPNSHECPGDVDKKDENSYSNAIGCLIDEKPILSFEAFVAGLPNWGINTTPGPDDPDQQTITLLCAAHNIFNNTVPVDETIEFVTSSGLQGFSGLEAPSGMIYIATIPDGSGGTRITCCERQTVIEARMMIMGLNNKAMGSVTDEGKIIIKQIIEYLLQIKNIADCALVFDNKDGDHKWSNPKNWYPAYNAVPKPFQAVRIEQDCQVDNTAAHCSSIRLVKGQKENSLGELTNYDAKLTILPNGGLTVTGFIKEVHDANFMTTYAIAPEDLIIQADKNSNGTLVYGDEEQDLQATVEYYSSAYGAGTANPVWQYMGIPIINRPTAISQYHYSWMCSWENIGNVSSNWVWVENEDKVVPFKGYCITQAEEKKFEHKGTLCQPTKTSLSMAYFTSMDGDGFNMFANSWVAPIDITKMEVADFGGAAEATIFIYNTGSRAQYEADGTTPSTDGTNTGAGQYNAIPVAASSYMAGTLTKIPTMQGFFIKATKAGTLTLDYDRLCFNTSTFETTAEKMRAPQRVQDEDTTTEDVQPIVPQVMRLDVNSNTWGDRLYILTHNEFSDAFNMGWDGSKQMGDEVAPMLALSAPTGLLAVAAIDDANGRYLSFRAGKDSIYTFTFDYNGQPLYLYDQLEERATEIKTGNTYTFTATNKTVTQRFLITDTPPQEVPTSITLVETENSLHFENYGNQLVNVRIVDMQGRVVYTSNTTDEIVYIQPSLPLGVYLAHITMGNDSKVVRLIGKETK